MSKLKAAAIVVGFVLLLAFVVWSNVVYIHWLRS